MRRSPFFKRVNTRSTKKVSRRPSVRKKPSTTYRANANGKDNGAEGSEVSVRQKGWRMVEQKKLRRLPFFRKGSRFDLSRDPTKEDFEGPESDYKVNNRLFNSVFFAPFELKTPQELLNRARLQSSDARIRTFGLSHTALKRMNSILAHGSFSLTALCDLIGRIHNKIPETQKHEDPRKLYPGLVKILNDYMTYEERRTFFDAQLPKVLYFCAQQCRGESISLPMLTPGGTPSVDVTRREVAYILSLMFLGDNFITSPNMEKESKNDNTDDFSIEQPYMEGSMRKIYESTNPTRHQAQKFKCLIAYITSVQSLVDTPGIARTRGMGSASKEDGGDILFYPRREGEGLITYHRRGVYKPVVSFSMLSDKRNSPQLTEFEVVDGPIQSVTASHSRDVDGDAPRNNGGPLGLGSSAKEELAIQTVFSSFVPGQGFFDTGCGQEEMMMCMYPETILMHYLLEPLDDTEVGAVIGAYQFNEVSGFGADMSFKASRDPKTDPTPYDIYGRKATTLVFMDPLETHYIAEWGMETLTREVFKSYVAFSLSPILLGEHYPIVATGNWGGGAANGDPHLRLMMQWIATTYAGRRLRYHILPEEKDHEAFQNIHKMEEFGKKAELTIADIILSISAFSSNQLPEGGLFGALLRRHAHRHGESEP